MADFTSSDPEKGVQETTVEPHQSEEGVTEKYHVASQVDDLSQVEASKGWFGTVLRYASFLRAEERGIERVKKEDRIKQSVYDGYTVWASANFT